MRKKNQSTSRFAMDMRHCESQTLSGQSLDRTTVAVTHDNTPFTGTQGQEVYALHLHHY